MAKLTLNLTYKEEVKLNHSLKARGREFSTVNYFEATCRIGDIELVTFINQFAFFYEYQDLEDEYTIEYDVDAFLAGDIFDAIPIDDWDIPKNVIFAFEYALIKHYLNESPHKEKYFDKANSTQINLLYQKELNLKLKEGQVIKYKISHTAPLRGIIEDLDTLARKGLRIRLDGNRCLSTSVLESILYNLDEKTIAAIEYIEEPFTDLSTWSQFSWADRMQVACDESFVFKERKYLDESINHLILKFGVNISVFEYFQLRHDERDWKITVTSGFEIPKLFNFVIHLASLENNAAGLSTFKFFENTVKLFQRYDEGECLLTASPM